MHDAWREAGEDLDIEIVVPFESEIAGTIVFAIAFLPDFGSGKGTLVFDAAENPNVELAYNNGYYCSQLSSASYSLYSRKLFQETLDDWQWSSKEKQPPSWYTGEAWS